MKVPTTKVKVVPLAYKFMLQSDSTTSWRYFELELSQIQSWGPHLSEITVHSLTQTRTPQQEWKVVLWFSLDGKQWDGPHDIFTAVVANGDVVHTPFADKTKFGMNIKLGLAVHNSVGTNSESAVVSAAGAFSFLT